MTDYERDSRGVKRGRCNKCSCHKYTKTDSVKCSRCGHPPGVHQNPDQPTHAATAPSHDPVGSTSYAAVAGGSTGYGSSVYGAGQSYAGENYGGQFSSPALPVTVPNCKADSCMNPAFYDPEVGMFDYCSPSCRDTYLLPKEKLKLQTDIHELEEQLQAVGVAQKKLCPSVKASSVDPPRTSTNSGRDLEVVKISKHRGDPLGLIIGKMEFKKGLFVTGVELSSITAPYFKRGDLHFLDMITHVNGKCSKTLFSAQDIVQSGDVEFRISRPIVLANPKKLIAEAERLSATHVFALMPPKKITSGDQDPLGLSCGRADVGIAVEGTGKDKLARDSGLEYGDIILLYTSATKDHVDMCKQASYFDQSSFEDYICKAAKDKKTVILVVRRSRARQTTV